jgi:hypothetical protein
VQESKSITEGWPDRRRRPVLVLAGQPSCLMVVLRPKDRTVAAGRSRGPASNNLLGKYD